MSPSSRLFDRAASKAFGVQAFLSRRQASCQSSRAASRFPVVHPAPGSGTSLREVTIGRTKGTESATTLRHSLGKHLWSRMCSTSSCNSAHSPTGPRAAAGTHNEDSRFLRSFPSCRVSGNNQGSREKQQRTVFLSRVPRDWFSASTTQAGQACSRQMCRESSSERSSPVSPQRKPAGSRLNCAQVRQTPKLRLPPARWRLRSTD